METLRYLVTGASGQLGSDLSDQLVREGHEVLRPRRQELDLARSTEVMEYVRQRRPERICHCAAYTKVDRAEEEKAECYQVNVAATSILSREARYCGAKMLYISTDYIFDGSKQGEYGIADVPSPLNYYGLTKLLGEECVRSALDDHLIARISWVFGAHGENFVDKMLKLGREREELRIVSDQRGSPTYTKDLAPLLIRMLDGGKIGTFHATNEGDCSWQEFATEIMTQAGLNVKVLPITTGEYPTKAKRPSNSLLSKERLDEEGLPRLPRWQDAVARYLKEKGVR
jgi:dTDP-4-dehydrorhamnose reductase